MLELSNCLDNSIIAQTVARVKSDVALVFPSRQKRAIVLK